MIARLLQGRLVGEVRKFLAPRLSGNGYKEFDLFFDPMVHVEAGDAVRDAKSLSRWVGFAVSCLKFDPEVRIHSAALFTDALKTLLDDCPLSGFVRIPFPTEIQLVAARCLDGSESVAGRLSDVVVTEKRATGVNYSHPARPGRRCSKGHSLDPSWETCPYCEAEGRSSEETTAL
jgi:hypothetical protein